MRSHPFARVLLLLTAMIVVVFANTLATLALCMAVSAFAFVALRQFGLLLSLGAILLPLLLISGILWMFVYLDLSSPDIAEAFSKLFAPQSRYFLFLRMGVSSSIIVLALGTIPDGEVFPSLRKIGLPANAAIVIASGLSLVNTVRSSFERSFVAFRAQGFVRPTPASRFLRLAGIASLTWTSSLHTAISRAEIKWTMNRYLELLQNGDVGTVTVNFMDTGLSIAFSLIISIVATELVDVDYVIGFL